MSIYPEGPEYDNSPKDIFSFDFVKGDFWEEFSDLVASGIAKKGKSQSTDRERKSRTKNLEKIYPIIATNITWQYIESDRQEKSSVASQEIDANLISVMELLVQNKYPSMGDFFEHLADDKRPIYGILSTIQIDNLSQSTDGGQKILEGGDWEEFLAGNLMRDFLSGSKLTDLIERNKNNPELLTRLSKVMFVGFLAETKKRNFLNNQYLDGLLALVTPADKTSSNNIVEDGEITFVPAKLEPYQEYVMDHLRIIHDLVALRMISNLSEDGSLIKSGEQMSEKIRSELCANGLLTSDFSPPPNIPKWSKLFRRQSRPDSVSYKLLNLKDSDPQARKDFFQNLANYWK